MRYRSHFPRTTRFLPARYACLLIALLCAGLGAATQGWSATATDTQSARFRTLSGETLSLQEYRGTPVLLSFWSTSCVICLQEMSQMKSLYHALKAMGADMISITMPYDPPNHVVELAESFELPFPVAIDLDGSLTRMFEIKGAPMKLLVSPAGEITETFLGSLDYEKTHNAVKALLEEAS